MLTFTDQLNMSKSISNLSDVTSLSYFSRDINVGIARFLAKLGRPVDRQERYASSVAGQQYYQMPEDAIRASYIVFLTGTNIWRKLEEVGDESTWIAMNQVPQQSSTPTHMFIKGYDEFGIYPTPSTTVTDNIRFVFEPDAFLLTAQDYTTGTVSLNNNSAVVTGNGTTFTPTMANGSYVLQVTDGTDGSFYKIVSYTNATTISLENVYQGITSGTASYRIGQVSKIPHPYQEAPVDYAMFRHFLEKGEQNNALLYKNLWETSLKDAEGVYGMSTSNQIITASGSTKSFNPLTDITMNQIQTS